MMDGATLQNLISKGWGTAARRTGFPYVLYRPCGVSNPLGARNRVIKLNAALEPARDAAAAAAGYGGALWRAVFDSLYSAAGDYLQGPGGVFFVASQVPLQPALCVRTSNVVTLARAWPAMGGGYSGFVADDSNSVIVGWPALLTAGGLRMNGTLPEAYFGNWTAFLPVMPIVPQVADILLDDLGRRFVVGAAQTSVLGWRLAMRQIDG
jgi:hypothetical protein